MTSLPECSSLQDKTNLQRLQHPATIVVREQEKLFYADQYAPIMPEVNPRIFVRIIPGAGHSGMTIDKPALEVIARKMHIMKSHADS